MFDDNIKLLVNQFVLALPNFLKAIGLILLGWILAKIISGVLKKMLKAIKIDHLAEKINDIDIIGNSNLKLVPSAFLSKLVYYFIIFVFLIAATEALHIEAITKLMTDTLSYIPVLLSALFVFIIGLFLADSLKKMVFSACTSLNIPAAGLISNLLFYFVFVNILVVSLTQAKINTEFIQNNISIILAGIVLAFSIGYGLATRDLAASFIASIYNKGKINIGDSVIIDDTEGVIVDMDNICITLLSNGNKVVIPLNKLNTNKIVVKATVSQSS